nr:hypothetical protein [Tanacetum cinerariifolium]
YANLKKKWSGVHYKRMFWPAASSTIEQEFLSKMKDIIRFDPEAHAYLMKREPASWCKAFFQPAVKCVSFENGTLESFNGKIVTARGKPIITMLEDIRLLFQTYLHCHLSYKKYMEGQRRRGLGIPIENDYEGGIKISDVGGSSSKNVGKGTGSNVGRGTGSNVGRDGRSSSKRGGGSVGRGGGSNMKRGGGSVGRGGGSSIKKGGGSVGRCGGSNIGRGGGSVGRGGGLSSKRGSGSVGRGGGSRSKRGGGSVGRGGGSNMGRGGGSNSKRGGGLTMSKGSGSSSERDGMKRGWSSSFNNEDERQLALDEEAAREGYGEDEEVKEWDWEVVISKKKLTLAIQRGNNSLCGSRRGKQNTLEFGIGSEVHIVQLSKGRITKARDAYSSTYMQTPVYISSGFLQNPISPTPYVLPSKKDYEILFQPFFDEYFNPLPRAVSLDSVVVAAPRAVDPACFPSSTTIDQDVPSTSTSPTN